MLYTKKNSGAYHGQGNNYAHKRNMHCIRLNPMRRVVPPKRNTQSATMAGISRWWYWKLWKIFSKQIKNWGYNKTATAPESGHQFYWRGCKRGLPTSVSSDVSMLWSRSYFSKFQFWLYLHQIFILETCLQQLSPHTFPYYSCSQLSAFWPLTNLGIYYCSSDCGILHWISIFLLTLERHVDRKPFRCPYFWLFATMISCEPTVHISDSVAATFPPFSSLPQLPKYQTSPGPTFKRMQHHNHIQPSTLAVSPNH